MTRGEATHIHLYEPSRWPPGVREQASRLDWPHVAQIMKAERFQGTASLVLAPEGDVEQAAQTSLKFLRPLLNGARHYCPDSQPDSSVSVRSATLQP